MENLENKDIKIETLMDEEDIKRKNELFAYEMTVVKMMLRGKFSKYTAKDMKNAGIGIGNEYLNSGKHGVISVLHSYDAENSGVDINTNNKTKMDVDPDLLKIDNSNLSEVRTSNVAVKKLKTSKVKLFFQKKNNDFTVSVTNLKSVDKEVLKDNLKEIKDVSVETPCCGCLKYDKEKFDYSVKKHDEASISTETKKAVVGDNFFEVSAEPAEIDFSKTKISTDSLRSDVSIPVLQNDVEKKTLVKGKGTFSVDIPKDENNYTVKKMNVGSERFTVSVPVDDTDYAVGKVNIGTDLFNVSVPEDKTDYSSKRLIRHRNVNVVSNMKKSVPFKESKYSLKKLFEEGMSGEKFKADANLNSAPNIEIRKLDRSDNMETPSLNIDLPNFSDIKSLPLITKEKPVFSFDNQIDVKYNLNPLYGPLSISLPTAMVEPSAFSVDNRVHNAEINSSLNVPVLKTQYGLDGKIDSFDLDIIDRVDPVEYVKEIKIPEEINLSVSPVDLPDKSMFDSTIEKLNSISDVTNIVRCLTYDEMCELCPIPNVTMNYRKATAEIFESLKSDLSE